MQQAVADDDGLDFAALMADEEQTFSATAEEWAEAGDVVERFLSTTRGSEWEVACRLSTECWRHVPSWVAVSALFMAADHFDPSPVADFLRESASDHYRASLAAANRLTMMVLTDAEKRDHDERVRLIAPDGIRGGLRVRTEMRYEYGTDDESGQVVAVTARYTLLPEEP